MHSDPRTPQSGPGTPHSNGEASGRENQSDDEKWEGGAKSDQSEDEEEKRHYSDEDRENSDDEGPRNRKPGTVPVVLKMKGLRHTKKAADPRTASGIHLLTCFNVSCSHHSMSLHLGNEVFDVYKAPLQGDHNHLFIRQGTGLQGQAVFKTKLTFRPHSTDSATHRKMTLSLADRCSKTQKIRILPMAGRDPESQRNEMIKVMLAGILSIYAFLPTCTGILLSPPRPNEFAYG
ncbi:hypothetical protein XENOCAPTIV_000875 [Xenoophorus captivus]|uniref:RNA polymerase-associated protein LEO1 n=1 Tax=Xenoophorus captivus TaxID=1517983 RepID=A0ABV0R611_9TELE